MNRRKFLGLAATASVIAVTGCAGDIGPATETGSPSDRSDTTAPSNCTDTAESGPQSPYDSLTLYQMPDYVTGYDESVILQYDSLGSAAQQAVQHALNSSGAYRECIHGRDQTDIMALFSHIDRRWERTGESFEHTYLNYDPEYYGITLVQEGDFIRVKSIPCTAEACPTTPTPPD